MSQLSPALTARFSEAQTRQRAGDVAGALIIYRSLLTEMAENAQIWLATGTAELQLGHDAEAIRLLTEALRRQPALVPAHANISVALQKEGRAEEALGHIVAALKINPQAAPLQLNRGNILRALERREEALEAYDAALKIMPDYAQALNNRGALKRELGDFTGSLTDAEAAIARAPNYSEAWNNKGTVLRDLNRPAEALAAFTRAVEIRPRNASAQWQKGAMELLFGDYRNGWRDFQARWRSPKLIHGRPPYPEPEWLGQCDPAGKTILVFAEQGLGDTLQFCRFVPQLEARGAKVILEVQAPLIPLIRTLPGTRTLVAMNAAKPAFDMQVPLMSLPLALGTEVETIPAASGYFSADAEKQAAWQARLGPKTTPRIGLCWSGREGFAANRWRNIPVELFAPLTSQPFEFHALQKEVHASDQAALDTMAEIRRHMDALTDFADTAALIAQMDLVITVDTAIAHVAGALGKPVWIITPQRPEWRWLTERRDSPWYDSARLFRPDKGAPEKVIADICTALARSRAS